MHHPLKQHLANVPDFPKPGIVFRDLSPLLRDHLRATIDALDALLTRAEWEQIDAIAGVESRGFILAAALAERHGVGFVPVRKRGKLPPPVVAERYSLEYGEDVLEMKHGSGRVLLVDDVLATGGTLRAAAKLCASAGYEVRQLAVFLDIGIAPPFVHGALRARVVIDERLP